MPWLHPDDTTRSTACNASPRLRAAGAHVKLVIHIVRVELQLVAVEVRVVDLVQHRGRIQVVAQQRRARPRVDRRHYVQQGTLQEWRAVGDTDLLIGPCTGN